MKKKTRRQWTAEDLDMLHRLYPDMPTRKLADLMGRTDRCVYARANHLGLRKSDAYYEEQAAGRIGKFSPRGVGTQFQKGNVPWNKGATGWIAPGRSAETRFAPGLVPPNTRELGETRLSKEGLLYRKFSDEKYGSPSRRWRSVHRLVWEEVNGPTPPGHRVCFKAGMFTNIEEEITLDKLELLSHAEVMKRNSMHNNPDLARLHQLKGAINRQVRRISRETREQRA